MAGSSFFRLVVQVQRNGSGSRLRGLTRMGLSMLAIASPVRAAWPTASVRYFSLSTDTRIYEACLEYGGSMFGSAQWFAKQYARAVSGCGAALALVPLMVTPPRLPPAIRSMLSIEAPGVPG